MIVGAEEHVPKWKDECKVAVAMPGLARVMDPVHLRGQEHPVQRPESDAGIQVSKAR